MLTFCKLTIKVATSYIGACVVNELGDSWLVILGTNNNSLFFMYHFGTCNNTMNVCLYTVFYQLMAVPQVVAALR